MSVDIRLDPVTVPLSDLLAPLSVFFNTLMLAAHADVAKPGRVPIDTGYLRNSLAPGGGVTEVDPASPPMWAAVGTNVPYGTHLEFGDNYHYLGGPSAGKATKGWLSTTIPNIEGAIGGAVAELAAGIQAAYEAAQ